MNFRTATIDDINQMQVVRNSVKENTLSNPKLITDAEYTEYLTVRGKGWVCEIDKNVVAFAIADLISHNIWALFVNPRFEGKGIGSRLHHKMLFWYFGQTSETVWLGTYPGTRAEKFYRKCGWTENGMHGNEIKFEMTYSSFMLVPNK
jgi:GNAT superfamily N-acetyltransferase